MARECEYLTNCEGPSLSFLNTQNWATRSYSKKCDPSAILSSYIASPAANFQILLIINRSQALLVAFKHRCRHSRRVSEHETLK